MKVDRSRKEEMRCEDRGSDGTGAGDAVLDYAAMMVGWTRHGRVATLPPLLVQPVAVADVADVLVQVAVGAPRQGA
jgi:hypothetical protein